MGVCEPVGYCSFPDPSCPSGSRFSSKAGDGLGGACVTPLTANGPIAFVQQSSGSTTTATTLTIAFKDDLKAHDAVLVAVAVDDLTGFTATDSNGKTLTTLIHALTYSPQMLVFPVFDVEPGPYAVTLSLKYLPTSVFSAAVLEYAGLKAPQDFQSGKGVSSKVDGMSSGLLNPQVDNTMLFGFGVADTAAAGTGFIERTNGGSIITEDRIVSAAGMYEATATMTGGANWTMLGVSFAGY